MKRQTQGLIKKIITSSWHEDQLSIPCALLKYYKKLGLNEQEMMFYLHILNFQKTEGKSFPGISDLVERMTVNKSDIMKLIQRLVTSGYLRIEDKYDEIADIRYEIYNTKPLLDQLCEIWLQEEGWLHKLETIHQDNAQTKKDTFSSMELLKGLEEIDIFTVFEREFGRPLSPIECERIVKWVDEDQFAKELIIEALKQAVLIGKFSMMYIDRILFEWKKKNIRTIHDANQANIEYQERKSKKTNNKKNSSNQNEHNYEHDKELWYWLNIDSQEGR
jgi:DNA replication protein